MVVHGTQQVMRQSQLDRSGGVLWGEWPVGVGQSAGGAPGEPFDDRDDGGASSCQTFGDVVNDRGAAWSSSSRRMSPGSSSVVSTSAWVGGQAVPGPGDAAGRSGPSVVSRPSPDFLCSPLLGQVSVVHAMTMSRRGTSLSAAAAVSTRSCQASRDSTAARVDAVVVARSARSGRDRGAGLARSGRRVSSTEP